MDLFGRTIAIAERHLERLSEHVGATPVPPELVREALGSLAVTLDQLRAAAEDIRLQYEALQNTRNTLGAERQRYQELLEGPAEGYLITDQRGFIQGGDRCAARWLRTPQHNLVGKPLAVYIEAADRPTFWTLLARLQTAAIRQECELRLQPCGGTLFPALVEVAAICIPWSREPALHWSLREVSGRPQAEAVLHASETRFRDLVEGSIQGVMIHRYFKPLFVNSAYTVMFGYSPAELLALDSTLVLFAPHERQRLRGYHDARLRGEPAPTHYEFQGVKKDGAAIWLETRAQVVEWEGIRATQASVVDVTARKSAEANLQTRLRQQAAVADLGQRALAGIDLPTLMQETTRCVAQTLGVEYGKVLELQPDGQSFLLRAGVGWRAGAVGRVTVGAGLDSQAGYTLWSGRPVIVEDLRTETRFRGPPLLHDHGVVSGMSVIIQGAEAPFGVLGADTTRLRTFTADDIQFLQAVANILGQAIVRSHLESALRLANDALERQVQERTGELVRAHAELAARHEELQALYDRAERDAALQASLLQELNHRVRNNLAAILGVLEIERERAHLRTADDALAACISRLQAITRVHDILAADNFGAGELREFLEVLAHGISRAGEGPRLQIAYDQVSLRLPPKAFLAVACITHELILNAVKHAFRGRPHGCIQIRVEEEGERYILEVRDDGIGMTAEAAGRGTGLEIVAMLCRTDLCGEDQFLQDGGTVARIIFPKAVVADGEER